MNETTTITLPGRDEMLARLRQAADDPYLTERFYPPLLANAGQEKAPEGVALMLQLAEYDYTQGLPLPAVIAFRLLLPRITAALVTDQDALARILELLA